jgi:hypothetical protein
MPQSQEMLAGLENKASTEAIRRTSLLVAVIPCVLLAIIYGTIENPNIYGTSILYPALLLSLIGWLAK